MTFYTYIWLREDGTAYYVGKAQRLRRAWRKGSPPRERIITQDWENEDSAFEAEMFLISYYGRKDNGTGILRNLTNGGEGETGWIPPKEWREARSKSLKGNKLTLGYRHTEESRKKMSESRKGKKHWWGAKIGAAQIGNQRGKANKGIVFTAEWRRNLSLAQQRRYARPTNPQVST